MSRVWSAAAATVLVVPAVVAAGAGPVAAAAYTCGGETATLVGTAEADTLVGTAGADVIVGLGAKDSVEGLAGADRLCGGRGVDTIGAGGGDDTVWGGADGRAVFVEGDFIEGGPGDDTLHGGLDPDESGGLQTNEDVVVYDDAPRGVRVTLGEPTVTGQGIDTIDGFYSVVGSEHDDDITAGAETDVVKGLGGADTMRIDSNEGEVFGGAGNDQVRLGKFVFGNRGDDTIINARADVFGGQGDDLLLGRSHRDELYGGSGDDVLRGRGGPDDLLEEAGTNRIVGGDGADSLRGGHGRDVLVGGDGDDQLDPGDYVPPLGQRERVADDVVLGGDRTDTVTYLDTYRTNGVRVDLRSGIATRVGRDRLASVENATGGHRGDDLLGDRGPNVLTGNGGDDHIVGRGGADTAIGVDGTDRCDAETELSCES